MRVPYKDLSLQQIRSFREVCRLGSYAEAGRAVNLSTSAVWEQMRGLERQLELPLLEQRQGRVQPTPDGLHLLDLLSPVLASLNSVKEELHQRRGHLPERITVASGMRMLMEEVAQAVRAFKQRYPGVCIRVLFDYVQSIEQRVAEGSLEVALMLEPRSGKPSSHDVVFEPAYELDHLLVAPPDHPLLKKRSLRLEDVLSHPLIIEMPGTSSRETIDEVLHRRNLLGNVKIAVETASAAITLACVAAGAGVAILPGHLQSVRRQGLAVRSLRTWFGAARYVFAWRRGAHIPPLSRELADMIRLAASIQQE